MKNSDTDEKGSAKQRLVFTSRIWRKDLNRYVYASEYGKKAFAFYVNN